MLIELEHFAPESSSPDTMGRESKKQMNIGCRIWNLEAECLETGRGVFHSPYTF